MKIFYTLFLFFGMQFLLADTISKKQAIVLGTVQGVTEFLPVSSTGHMILANEFIFKSTEESSLKQQAVNNYMVCIQIGTILTLLVFYRKYILCILRGWLGRDKQGFLLGLKVGLAFIPAGLLGYCLDDYIQLHFYNRFFIGLSLLVGGLAILALEKYRRVHESVVNDIYDLSIKGAIVIGLFQMIALWPGFSRSLATIIGGIWVGLSLTQAIHFSFLLGLLTSSVATGYKLLKGGWQIFDTIPFDTYILGIVLAFIIGLSTIAIFLKYIQQKGLGIFGYYRIIIGLVLSIF